MTLGGNRYDLRELAGAFGDLGTLVPFVVGYVTITGLDPIGIFVAFGVSLVGAGLYFRTPVPVQPMKAIATAAINHPATVTAGAIGVASLFTAALWLVMGLTGAATWLARITSRPVMHGIVLGLGEFVTGQAPRRPEHGGGSQPRRLGQTAYDGGFEHPVNYRRLRLAVGPNH